MTPKSPKKLDHRIKKQRERSNNTSLVSQVMLLPKVISHCTNPAFKGKKIKYVLVS
jgi:hypothetical protein